MFSQCLSRSKTADTVREVPAAMYGLSAADEDIQARARAFADELIPFEVEAELSGGLPDDVTAAHKKRAIELGLFATNLPRELGGGGATTLQQVLVQEQVGRVTNALGWVAATPPSWFPPVATRGPGRAVPAAHDPRRARGVLRDHRGGRGQRRGRDRGDRPPRRRRLGPERREVARHQLQHRRLLLLPGEEDHDAERGRPIRRRAPALPGRPAQPRGVRGPHARLHAHDQPPPPDRRVHRRPGARGQPGRRGRRRHALLARVVPLRAADGRRPAAPARPSAWSRR